MHFFHLQTAGYPQPHLCALCAPHPPPRLVQGSKGQELETQGEKLIVSLYKEKKKNPHITQHHFCLFAWSAWKGLRSAPDMH